MRRNIGLGLLYVASSLVIAGSMYDLFVPTVPPNLLAYQGVTRATIDPRVAALELGLLRALGGCLLAIGATALVLVHGPIRRGERWASHSAWRTMGSARPRDPGRRVGGEQRLPDDPVRVTILRPADVRRADAGRRRIGVVSEPSVSR
jgi:hypothetical protein